MIYIHLCLPLLAYVCLCLLTSICVYLRLLVFTYAYACLLISCFPVRVCQVTAGRCLAEALRHCKKSMFNLAVNVKGEAHRRHSDRALGRIRRLPDPQDLSQLARAGQFGDKLLMNCNFCKFFYIPTIVTKFQ